jgi:hypothetical protein
MTVSVGNPTLTNRVLLTVPVTVVCAPLADPNLFADEISVSVSQAFARSITTGSNTVGTGAGTPFGNGSAFTCDGVTKNTVLMQVFPDSGTGPFHAGPAIFTVQAFHVSGGCDPVNGCVATGEESAQVGPTSIVIRS